jgi:hypothetical protein
MITDELQLEIKFQNNQSRNLLWLRVFTPRLLCPEFCQAVRIKRGLFTYIYGEAESYQATNFNHCHLALFFKNAIILNSYRPQMSLV